jgi:quercetin dioxygenase-like cupin family protein
MPPRKTGVRTPVGKRIKLVRQKKKITFEMLANETGFSVEYLKRIESGKEVPPVGVLLTISRALQIDSVALLEQQSDTKRKDRIKAYAQRTANYAYTTLTPGAENKHLKAFKVAVDPMTDHKGVSYQHEGEEFVYVLEGQVEVIVGDHVNKLKPGDSLHFNSGIRHLLKNTGKKTAQLVVVIYGP